MPSATRDLLSLLNGGLMSGKRHQPPRRDPNRLADQLAEAGKTPEWAGGPKLATVVKHPSARRPRAPRTLRAAIDGGSERDALVVLRRKLAALIDGDPPAYQAVALMRQFREVDAQLRALDELEAERARAEDGDDENDDEGDDDESFDPNSL